MAASSRLTSETPIGWLAALILVGAAACSADPPVPCNTAPETCEGGTTCWPTDMGGAFSCLPSKPYKGLGSDCALLVGSTTCSDGMVCAPMKGKDDIQLHRCTTYCTGGNPCSTGATCTSLSLFSIGPQVEVCILPAPTP